MSNYITIQSKINEPQRKTGSTAKYEDVVMLNENESAAPFIMRDGEVYVRINKTLQYRRAQVDWRRFVRDMKAAAKIFHEFKEREREEEKSNRRRRRK